MEKYKVLILEDNDARIKDFKQLYKEYDLTITDNANIAIKLLQKEKYFIISLDNDLGELEMEYDPDNCGIKVARFIAEHKIDKESIVFIHSFNYPATREMKVIIPSAVYLPGYWMWKTVPLRT